MMFKKLFTASAIALALFSCNNEEKHDGYFIHGNIDASLNGKKVTLTKNDRMDRSIVDSTTVKEGEIVLEGVVDYPDFYTINIEGERLGIPLVVENGDLMIEFYKDSLDKSKIKGSKENDLMNSIRENSLPLMKFNQTAGKKYADAQKINDTIAIKNIKSSFDSLMETVNIKNTKLIKDHPDQVVSAAFLDNLINMKTVETKEAKDIYEGFSYMVKESRIGQEVGKKIEASMATAVGSKAPEFSAPTPAGDTLALKDVMGKVTIIDFWAAWCQPCRKENPNVVKVYEKYHDQGLEILGVSLDGTPRQKDAKEAWTKAIEEDGLTWNHVSNLQYFKDPIAQSYNIQAIPATFILDSEGNIVAKDLRGDELDKKIGELLQ